MQRLLILICTFMSLTLAATAANAQFYLGGHGGANFLQDSDMEADGGVDGTASFDPGFAVGGIAGYRFDVTQALSIDVEGEFAYRANDIDSISVTGVPDSDGESQSFAWMANAWVHWKIAESAFAPYAGGGFGGVHVDIKGAEVGATTLDNESDFVIGGQIGGGLAYMINEDLEVSLDYRFLLTEDARMNGIEVEYQAHSVLFGFKYLF